MEILLISRVLGEQGGAKDRQSQSFHKIQPFLVHTKFSLYNTHLGLERIRSLGNFCTTKNCLHSNILTFSTNKQRNVFIAIFQDKEGKIEMYWINWNPQLRILYMAGFRLGPDTTRRVSWQKQKRKRRIFFAVAQLLWQSQKLELDNLTIFFIFLTCDHCDWPDIISQVNKDYLKKIKLFRARASPSYCAVAFQMSQDLETDDPMWEQPSTVFH